MRLSEYDLVKACTTPLAAGIRPEPEVLVSDWATEHRVLVQVSSAEPGGWRNERTPYLVEPMNCLSAHSGIEQVAVMKGAQGGWTEAGNNWTGYVIHKAPGPMLYVQPTVDSVKKYSRMRLAPMIEACPPLRERIRDARSRDSSNTMLMKEFPGGVLILGGANSAAALRSMPIRFLFLDECDAYPSDVDGEGDPNELAEKRTTTFRNRKIFKISTPTLVGLSHIEKAYKLGDMRQWWMPCPLCQNLQVMRWRFEDDELPGGLVWKWGEPGTAEYQCSYCTKGIPEFRKTWMNNNGLWKPSRVEGGDPKVRSYHWPSLCSPYGWPGSSWPELAKKWEQGHKDPTKVKVFFNAELGLPYEDKAARAAEPHVLMERCEVFPAPAEDGAIIIPNEVVAITFGADVQGNRIEWEFVGWMKDEESFSLDYGIVSGDTTTMVPFAELDKARHRRFRNEVGIELKVLAGCVDANYQTQTVTTWCGPRFKERVWATVGRAGNRPVWPRMPGATKYNATPLFTVGVDQAKANVVGRLSIADPGPGYSHFPVGREQAYFEQLTEEVCVTVYDKNPPYNIWKKKHHNGRNEALDCRVYAYAALCGLLAGGLNLSAESTKMGLMVVHKLASLVRPQHVPGATAQTNRQPRFQMRRQ